MSWILLSNSKKNSKKVKNIALCGVLTTLAMIFSYIDSLISIPIPVPGVRIGISNIAIITVLYMVGIKEAVIVNVLRITLTSILFGNIMFLSFFCLINVTLILLLLLV